MRRKLRITVGRNGLVYLTVTVLMFVVAFATQANLLFLVLGLMLGGLVVSFFMPIFMLKGVTIERLLPNHCAVGDPIHLQYQITNHSRLFPLFGLIIIEQVAAPSRPKKFRWLKLRKSVNQLPQMSGQPHGWMLHLGPRQTGQAQATGWPMNRGMLQFEQITIQTAFPFGIIRCVKTFKKHDQLLVYPRLYRVNRRSLHQLSSTYLRGKQQRLRNGGNDEFFGLREYHSGDSIKIVDWKHSAKIGRWISREMTQPAQPKLMLALDLTAESLQAASNEQSVENAISLAASMICDAHLRGFEAGMTILGTNLPVFRIHRSLLHRSRMLETLASIDLAADQANENGSKSRLYAEPTVIITPAEVRPSQTRTGRITISAAFMDHWVSEVDGGSESLLRLAEKYSPGRTRAAEVSR